MISVQQHQAYSEYNYQSTKHNQKNQNNLENKYLKWGAIIKITFQRQWPTTSKEKDHKKTLLLLNLINNHKASLYNNKLPILAVKDVYQISTCTAILLILWGENYLGKLVNPIPACQHTNTHTSIHRMSQLCLATPYQSQPPIDHHTVNMWTGNNQIAYTSEHCDRWGGGVLPLLMPWHAVTMQWHLGMKPSCTWRSIYTYIGKCPGFYVTQFPKAQFLSNFASNDKKDTT